MDELIAINDALEDENTMIRVDQELVINVPEPELSVMWKENHKDKKQNYLGNRGKEKKREQKNSR